MIIVVLPIYNEECAIGNLIKRIDKLMAENHFNYKIIAIDDGSTDGSVRAVKECAKNMPITLVEFKNNEGVGKVFKVGLTMAADQSENDDLIVTMDADNTHDPKLIKKILDKIEEGYEIVVPACFHKGGMLIGLSFLRRFLSRTANFIYSILFPIKGVREYTGFYRGYKAKALKLAFKKYGDDLIETKGFPIMAELLIKFRRIPLFITSIPMILRYDLKGEKSKLKVIPTVLEHIKVVLKNLFRRGLPK